MKVELRCSHGTLHGVLVDGHIEVKCRDRMCGYHRGVTILHYFDKETGQLVKTSRFQDPAFIKLKAQSKETA